MAFTRPTAPLELNPNNSMMPNVAVWALGSTGSANSFGRYQATMYQVGDGSLFSTTPTTWRVAPNTVAARLQVDAWPETQLQSSVFTRTFAFWVPASFPADMTVWCSATDDSGGGYNNHSMRLSITTDLRVKFDRSNIANMLNQPGQIIANAGNTIAITRHSDTSCHISINGNAPIAIAANDYWIGNKEQFGNFQYIGEQTAGFELGFYAHCPSDVTPTTLQALSNDPAIVVRTTGTGGGTATATVPNAPTIGTAAAGDGYVDFAFAPGADGGAATIDYTVTTSAGQTGTGSYSPVRVTVPNGTAVSGTVKARNSVGSSAASGSSNVVTPASGNVVTPPPQGSGGHGLTLTNATFGQGSVGRALMSGYGYTNNSFLPANAAMGFYIEFFFKHDPSVGGRNVLLSQDNALQIWMDYRGIIQYSMPGNVGSYQNYHNMNDGSWHHAYFRWTSTGIEMFIDGAGLWGGADNRTTSGYNPVGTMWVGCDPNGTNPFNGGINMLTVGLGDKYGSSIQTPTSATNPLGAGLIALYNFEGDGSDAAGNPGTKANGTISSYFLQGQTLHMEGTCFNNVASGYATLSPNSDTAMPLRVNIVVNVQAQTWYCDFTGIPPGSYTSTKVQYLNSSGVGTIADGPSFNIIAIEGGGDLGNGAAGATLAASAVLLSGPATGTVGVGATFTITTDNALASGVSKTVTLTSDKGSFNPASVVLSSTVTSVTSTYTASSAGQNTLTAATTGLTSATKTFTSSAAVVAAPTGKAVVITLKSAAGVVRANLTGLTWAFFDQSKPSLLQAPVAKGAAITDANGVLNVDVTTSSLTSGQVGWLIVSDSDGTTVFNSKAFCAPVAVS
jgi:hypothetical protein